MVDVTSGRLTAPVVVVARHQYIAFAVMMAFFVVAPFFVYPIFLMKALCFALFACAFNLLIGYAGLLSFGHAMFMGSASYAAAYVAKEGLSIESLRILSITIPIHLHLPPFPPELAILFGTACSGVLGIVAGQLLIKNHGSVFPMFTPAAPAKNYFVCLQAQITRAQVG